MDKRRILSWICAGMLAVQPLALAENAAAIVTLTKENTYASTVSGLNDGLCSWNMGGTDASTLEGDDYSFVPAVYIANNAYQAELSVAGNQEGITDSGIENVSIASDVRGTNGIVIQNSSVEIENVEVTMNASEEDGSTSCDFSGKGAAIAAYGNSDVTVKNSTISASGVANLGIFVDNGATLLLDSSKLFSAGGTLYAGYVNSPNQSTMVAPPWILGIMGTSRTSNLMGTKSTMTVVDSETSASNWAVLSTDAGSNMVLNVVNSSLTLTGSDTQMQADGLFDTENPYTSRSGYGTYAIGNAEETFLGVTMNVGTYATIFTGGSGYYGNLKAGETYELKKADGTVHTVYTAEEDVRTVINSDTFGFMAHQGTNEIVLDGAQVNSAYTSILIKSGNDTSITVENGAELNAENGILLQLMDNDDATTEFDSEATAFGMTHEEYAGFPTEAVADSTTAGQGGMDPNAGGDAPQMPEGGMGGDAPQMPEGGMGESAPEKPEGDMGGNPQMSGNSAGTTPPEKPDGNMSGNPPEKPDGDMSGNPPEKPDEDMGGNAPRMSEDSMGEGTRSSGSTAQCNTTTFTVTNTVLTGDLFNGIGWNANALSSGNVKQMMLNVNLQSGATLSGAIASTSCIHATYEGQQALKAAGITAFDNEEEAAAFAAQYQATSFTQSEYFNIGQVANQVKSNGINNISVTLTDDAVWNVTGTSLIDNLTIGGEARVIVAEGVTLTVGGTAYPTGTYTAADFR